MTPLRRLMLGAAAIAGLVGAHALDYALLIPDPAHRHDVLLRTGHGWLPFAFAIAAVAALAAVGTALASGIRGRATPRHPTLTLALVQGGGFVALEALERLGAGARFDRSVAVIVALGVLLQVVVAFVAVRLLGVAHRAGEAIAARARTPRHTVVSLAAHPEQVATGRPRAIARRAHAVRGPPLPTFA